MVFVPESACRREYDFASASACKFSIGLRDVVTDGETWYQVAGGGAVALSRRLLLSFFFLYSSVETWAATEYTRSGELLAGDVA